MAVRIEAPGGDIVEFPDGTPDDVILRVMRQNYPPPGPAPGIGERVVTGVGDLIQGGAQLLVNVLPTGVVSTVNRAAEAVGIPGATAEQINRQTAERERVYQARRGPDAGFDWARALGQTAAAVPLALALPAGGSLAGAAAAGAGAGAALSALQPVAEGDITMGKVAQIGTGATIGAITGPVGHLIGRAIAPRVDPQVRALRDAGVTMTPGQIAGGGARSVENMGTSVPILGTQIQAAQRRSIESFNRAVANRVLRPIGDRIDDAAPVGRDLISDTAARVSRAYDDVLARIKPFGPDTRFAREIQRAQAMVRTPNERAAFRAIIANDVLPRLQGAAVDGPTFKTIEAELGRRAANYRGSSIAAERELGDAFLAVQRAFQSLLERTNPAQRADLARVNTAYAALLRMQTAAAKSGAIDGVFSPAHLAQAVRETDRSLRKSAFARGDALLQDLADAAKNRLPTNVPDSGTAGRAALLALGTGYAAGVPLPYLAGGALAYGAYSRPGQDLLQALMTATRPQAVDVLGRAVAGSGGAAVLPLSSVVAPVVPNRPDQRREEDR